MKKPSRLGVLGVGHLMYHVVPGLMRAEIAPEICLSPRNAERAQRLAARYGLHIASSNEELVESCDIVIVALRPFQVEEAIKQLPWREDQLIISFAATIGSNVYNPLVNGARVALAMPVVAAEFGESPTCLFPGFDEARELLEPCGPVIVLEREEDFAAASAYGAYYGWVQKLISEGTDWLAAHGLSQEIARTLVAGMTRAGATTVLERMDTRLDDLIEELCLPGSLTGEGVELLEENGAFSAWHKALDTAYGRIKG